MTSGKPRALFLFVASTAALSALSRDARPWDSSEHEEMGKLAFQAACGKKAFAALPICSDKALNDLHTTIASKGTAAPDYCHSIYFSDVGIALNPVNKAKREGCQIVDGVPQPVKGDLTFLGLNKYVLYTNKQHFGDHVDPHAALYLGPAMTAAMRYKKHIDKGDNAKALACSKAAVALVSFGNHYVTDRTAAGHAWTPAGHGFSWAQRDQRMVGLLGCFHDQPSFFKKLGINLDTGFKCVSGSDIFKQHEIWVGLGTTSRKFAAPFYGANKPWYSDYDWAKAAAAPVKDQRSETIEAAVSYVSAVLAEMVGQKSQAQFDRTFVANEEMCKVGLGMCCRSMIVNNVGGGKNPPWKDPNLKYTAGCDYCNPDITSQKLAALCPVKQIQLEKGATGVWIKLRAESVWEDYYGVGRPWKGEKDYGLELARPTGDWDGANAAMTMAATEVGTIHPDAKWDSDQDIVSLLGCPDADGGGSTGGVGGAGGDGGTGGDGGSGGGGDGGAGGAGGGMGGVGGAGGGGAGGKSSGGSGGGSGGMSGGGMNGGGFGGGVGGGFGGMSGGGSSGTSSGGFGGSGGMSGGGFGGISAGGFSGAGGGFGGSGGGFGGDMLDAGVDDASTPDSGTDGGPGLDGGVKVDAAVP